MLKDLIDNIDVLTEDAKTSIQEAFELACEKKVEERVSLEVESALTQLDEQHAVQLETLIEAIDEDHSKKFEHALGHIDADHTAKLQQVVEHYESLLQEDAAQLHEQLSDDISNYLDLYLEKVVPVKDIKQATKTKHDSRIVESIRELVSVDEKFINENIKEALTDGKNRMESLSSKLNESHKENIGLSKKVNELEAKLLLNEKLEDMPRAKKAYLNNMLDGKSPSYIKENFEYVVEMFEKGDDERRLVVESAAKPQRKRPARRAKTLITEHVDTPSRPIVEKPVASSPANEYLNVLKSQETKL